jgi:Lon protease-like protein
MQHEEPDRSDGCPNSCGHLDSDESVLTVPLFPLPNVVLFPRAVLPLHIFEDRYKTMTAHALAGNRTIAMALLRPGWEKDYHNRPAIEPVVCIGKILTSEKLADGKYNFLLQGRMRAQIIRELPSSPYRMAEVRAIPQTPVPEIDLLNHRQRLLEMFCSGPLAETHAGMQIKQILASPLSTAEAADLIAFNLLDDIALKQRLLSEGDVVLRVTRLIGALQIVLPVLEATCRCEERDFSLN